MTRVLVVDDNSDNGYYLHSLLTLNGFEVDLAHNGAEALDVARRRRPGVIVSDLLMPVMDGYTLLRHWKADEALSTVPFVVYTATYTATEDERLAMNLGADAFIVKPAEPEEFLAKLHEVEAIIPSGVRHPTSGDERQNMREYSEALIRKLEDKTTQLEATNIVLRADIEERERVRIENMHLTRNLQAFAEQLEIERGRLIEAQQVAMMGSWENSIGAKTLVWSEETNRIFEAESGLFDANHASFHNVVHPDDVDALTAAFLRSLPETAPQEYEHRLLMPDGRIKYVRERWQVYHDEDGTPLRALGTCQDITARKLSEDALRASEALYRITAARLSNVLDYSLDVICSFDSEERFVGLNAASEAVFGYAPEELLGTRYVDYLLAEDLDITRAVVAGARAGRPVRNFENRCRRRNGSIAHLQWTVHWSDEEQIMFCVGRDVTETKHLEVQVARAQRMESIGTLAGGIAHDLNNVLSPIMMSIDLLGVDEHDPRRLDILEIIGGSARRGADMVKQLLSFASQVELDHSECDIADLLAEVATIVDETFMKTIEVRRVVADKLWVVEGDPTQLHQVLLNLCLNARDAMPQAGRLTLSARNVELDDVEAARNVGAHAGPYVLIGVTDTGTGMTAEVLDRAFEPFFTTKGIGRGTGLGLSTSQSIVRRHGGFIRTISEVGSGTEFSVYLPASPDLTMAVDDEDGTPLIRGTGQCVLVVDDEDAARQITKRMLEMFGYRVLLADDGADALACFAAHRDEIQVVITDMMMPKMDGPSLIAALAVTAPDMPVIAVSGLGSHETVERARRLGAARFIPKPFTAEILLEALNSVLNAPGR